MAKASLLIVKCETGLQSFILPIRDWEMNPIVLFILSF